MRILLDHCVHVRYGELLPGHEVHHTKEMGWELLGNGALLSAAEAEGFEIFLTVDKSLRFQQSFTGRKIVGITLNSRFTSYEHIALLAPKLMRLLEQGLQPGSHYLIDPD